MALVLNKPGFQRLDDDLFKRKELNVFVLRDDLIHPFVSGNKWRKLKYNIENFRQEAKEYLITFGGAYSNHIVATASAGKEYGIKTIGIIRGEELKSHSNSSLRFAEQCGMKLIFVSREKYRELREKNSLVVSELRIPDSRLYILPEGGSNELAVKGCSEITKDIPVDFDFIACACGTGTTLAGITSSLKNHQQAIGVSVFKGMETSCSELRIFANVRIHEMRVKMLYDYHFGGYGKSTTELEDFCSLFYSQHQIPIEPIYTGKLVFGIYDLIKKDFFERGKTIVLVHTGGVLNF